MAGRLGSQSSEWRGFAGMVCAGHYGPPWPETPMRRPGRARGAGTAEPYASWGKILVSVESDFSVETERI